MKQTIIKNILLILLLTSTTLYGQNFTGKLWSSDKTLMLSDVTQLADGSFLFTGTIHDYDLEIAKPVLIKSDSELNVLWTKGYQVNTNDIFSTIKPTQDGNFLVGGNIRALFLDAPYGGSLFKIDGSGNVLWNKLYTYDPGDELSGIYELADSTLMLFIVNERVDRPVQIVHTDATGTILSKKKIGITSTGLLNKQDVCEDANENFYYCGTAAILGDHLALYVACISANTLNWVKQYDLGRNTVGRSIAFLPDNSLIVGGQIVNEDPDVYGEHPVFIKLDLNGSVEWSREIKLPNSDLYCDLNTVEPLEGSDFLALGYQRDDPIYQGVVWKFNESGETVWATNNQPTGRFSNVMKPLNSGDIVYATGVVSDLNTLEMFLTFLNDQGETACTNSPAVYSNTPITVTTSELEVEMYDATTEPSDPIVEITDESLSVAEGCWETVSVDEKNRSTEVRIFPNPSSGLVNIRFDQSPNNTSLRIFDAHGKLVKELNRIDPYSRLDLSDQPPGLYLLQFITEKGVVTKRVVIE